MHRCDLLLPQIFATFGTRACQFNGWSSSVAIENLTPKFAKRAAGQGSARSMFGGGTGEKPWSRVLSARDANVCDCAGSILAVTRLFLDLFLVRVRDEKGNHSSTNSKPQFRFSSPHPPFRISVSLSVVLKSCLKSVRQAAVDHPILGFSSQSDSPLAPFSVSRPGISTRARLRFHDNFQQRVDFASATSPMKIPKVCRILVSSIWNLNFCRVRSRDTQMRFMHWPG